MNRLESVVCCEAFAGDVLRFFIWFWKIQLELIYFEIFWGSAFYFTECSFPSHQTEDWQNHDTCSNYNLAIQTIKNSFFSSLRASQISSFYKRRVIHLPSDLQKAWKCKHSPSHNCSLIWDCMPSWIWHYCCPEQSYQYPNPTLHFIINSLSEQTWNSLLRRAVMTRYAAMPTHSPQELSCLDLTNWWISPWLLTRITFCCLLLSVSFIQTAYDDLWLYFQPSAFCRSWPRIRED